MVVTADKGVAMVVIDSEDYMDTAHSILADNTTYKTITKDSTQNHKYTSPNT